MFYLKWLLPALLLVLVAPFTPAIDLCVGSFFCSAPKTFYSNAFLDFLFDWGELFGFAFGALTGLLFLGSFFYSKWAKLRAGALLILLTLVIGAGLITNLLLKEHWGRPRPKQITEFGGHQSYRPFWSPNFNHSEPQKSFPSGHVAMGFYYLAFCLAAIRYKNKKALLFGLLLTLFWGGGLMVGRVAQGGHFVSDVIVSPILMWYVALTVDNLLFRKKVLILLHRGL